MTAALSLECFRLRNTARVVGTAPLKIVTPGRWAYAPELPVGGDQAGPAVAVVRLAVTDGALGVGCVDPDGALIG